MKTQFRMDSSLDRVIFFRYLALAYAVFTPKNTYGLKSLYLSLKTDQAEFLIKIFHIFSKSFLLPESARVHYLECNQMSC